MEDAGIGPEPNSPPACMRTYLFWTMAMTIQSLGKILLLTNSRNSMKSSMRKSCIQNNRKLSAFKYFPLGYSTTMCIAQRRTNHGFLTSEGGGLGRPYPTEQHVSRKMRIVISLIQEFSQRNIYNDLWIHSIPAMTTYYPLYQVRLHLLGLSIELGSPLRCNTSRSPNYSGKLHPHVYAYADLFFILVCGSGGQFCSSGYSYPCNIFIRISVREPVTLPLSMSQAPLRWSCFCLMEQCVHQARELRITTTKSRTTTTTTKRVYTH